MGLLKSLISPYDTFLFRSAERSESAHAEGLLEAPPKNGREIAPSHLLVCAYLGWLAAYFEVLRTSALTGMAAP